MRNSASPAARRASLALLIIQPLLFYFRVLFNPARHIPYDILGFHLPLAAYIARCIREHTWPWWDPYSFCGAPIYADLQAQLFYPLAWVAIGLGNLSAGRNLYYWLEWLVPLHMILAGWFAFLLLRYLGLDIVAAFFGATVYQLGGFFASQAQHLGAICCAAWFPFVLLCVWKLSREPGWKWTGLLAGGLALCILAGFMAATLVVFAATSMVALGLALTATLKRRFVTAVVCATALAVGLAAVQLVPTYQLTGLSVAASRGPALGRGGGLRIQSLASLIAPNHYGIYTPFDPSKYQLKINFTFLYVYCGIFTLLLILAAPWFRQARYCRIFFILTVIFGVWMLGETTAVYRFVFGHLPQLLRGALYAEFALMGFSLFAALTAAAALHHWGRGRASWLVWSIAIFTSADLMYCGSERPMNSLTGGYRDQINEYQLWKDRGPLGKIQALASASFPPARMDYLAVNMFPGISGASLLKLPTADGNNPFALSRVVALRRLFCGGNWWERELPVNSPDSPLLSALNIGFLAIPADKPGPPGLEHWPIAEADIAGIRIHRNPQNLPRFFLVSRVHAARNEVEARAYLARPDFRPAQEAVIETANPIPDATLSGGSVQVEEYSANRVGLRAATAGRGFLASSEAWYPGWTATINGRRTQYYMTNGAFRGLFLDSGTSRIVMTFRPAGLMAGAVASVFSCILLAGTLFLGRSKIKKPRDRLQTIRRVMAGVETFWTKAIVPRQATLAAVALLLLATVAFYWKILLTRQFSLLTEPEGVSQAYAWLRFWTYSIRHFTLPLWDPYTLAGHTFPGEMQTAAFYPLHLLLAVFPPNREGLFSPALYHVWIAFTHFLGACFMFALIREFGLKRFPAWLGGICFALGGFVGRTHWPHMLESSIWLPLIVLFMLRAFQAEGTRAAIRNAVLGGLVMGLSILAGGLHVVIMQALVIGSAGLYHAFARRPGGAAQPRSRAALVVIIVVLMGFGAGGVQLVPSMEYSGHSVRALGPSGSLPTNMKIPYDYMREEYWPNSFLNLLMPMAFGGSIGRGELMWPYLGVFPILLVSIGIWKYRAHRWVRYLVGLGLAAFLYSWGTFSPLHGILYAIVPRLWMAREASRMVYLLDFVLAILAAFGAEALFSEDFPNSLPRAFQRILLGITVTAAATLFVAGVLGQPPINTWVSFSVVMILLSYVLYRYVAAGHTSRFVQVLIAGLVLFDLSGFDWSARNLLEAARTGSDHLERLRSCRGAVRFLQSRPAPYRVQIAADPKPNIGDHFGIPTSSLAGVTASTDYLRIAAHSELLNVRYVMTPASNSQPGAIYQDSAWKIFSKANAAPRAWIVHHLMVEPGLDRGEAKLRAPGFDPLQTAIVDSDPGLAALHEGESEAVDFLRLEANRLEVQVHAGSRGLLVLSETFFPGWYATVNGNPAQIYRADVGLRGVVVPRGDSLVVLTYRPWSVIAGGILTLGALVVAWIAVRRKSASAFHLANEDDRDSHIT